MPSPATILLIGVAGNGSFGGTAYASAPRQLTLAANDGLTNPKVAKLYFATAAANAAASFVGLAGLNQATLANVIREMNKNASTGRSDFYNLDNSDNNVFNIGDYWIDCLAPATDLVIATYWRS